MVVRVLVVHRHAKIRAAGVRTGFVHVPTPPCCYLAVWIAMCCSAAHGAPEISLATLNFLDIRITFPPPRSITRSQLWFPHAHDVTVGTITPATHAGRDRGLGRPPLTHLSESLHAVISVMHLVAVSRLLQPAPALPVKIHSRTTRTAAAALRLLQL